MTVKNHIVLFLDILGYSNLLTQCKNNKEENHYLNKIYSIINNLSQYIEASVYKGYKQD